MFDYTVNQEEVNNYLEELRESGEINMYGAVPHIQNEFGVNKQEARSLLKEWMEGYEND